MQDNINNKRIAKNTLYLYIRMLISMVLSLYTSRVIINVLGIDDFGIYSVVGGVVLLFSFVGNALRNATQRFMSYNLGKEDFPEANKVLNMSLQCHALYALVLIVLAGSIGLWFVINKLNLPEGRYDAAIIVYLISVLTFVVQIFQSPYHATIISNEKMSFFATISIVDVVLKLVIVFLLTVSPVDKLITYGLLLLMVSVVSLLLPMIYCYHKLGYERFRVVKDGDLFRQIFGYAGWSMYGGLAYVGAQQGGNFLINIFGNVAANGAFGIANQASSVLYGFVSNFQSAINPQIVKSYSSGQFKEMFALINRSSYFSYYIFLVLAAPIIVGIEYIIELWLGNCPEYAANFCRLMFLYFLVDSIQAPLWMLIGATGKMRVYSIWSGTLTLLNIPLAWLMLKLGCDIYWVFYVKIIINVVISCIRPFYLKHLLPSFSLKRYCEDALKRPLLVSIIVFAGVFVMRRMEWDIHPLFLIALMMLFSAVVIWLLGLKENDRSAVLSMVKERISKE